MARPRGSRNADYQAERDELAMRLWAHLQKGGASQASFRELAEAAEVSPATLRHYFADRDGALAAVLELLHRLGARHLADAADAPHGKVTASLRWLLHAVAEAWLKFGVGSAHAVGITAGLGSERLGPAYVNELLEPTLQSAEARIARHVKSGELARCDVRHAALSLLSPVVLGLLHQDALFGARCRPLDLEAFLDDHLAHWLQGYRARSKRV